MAWDADLLGLVSSANIACGYHAGDHNTIASTAATAVREGVSIGAHPGLPDRANFGRMVVEMAPEEVSRLTLYQLGGIAAIVKSVGGRLGHVKPHGALYHMAERDEGIASAFVEAVATFDPSLVVFGLSGGRLAAMAERRGLAAKHEVFADRGYLGDGSLAPRTREGSVIHDGAVAADRIAGLLKQGTLPSMEGSALRLRCDTLCLHGDSPDAARFAREFTARLASHGIGVAGRERDV
jgi:UPF0271 protein